MYWQLGSREQASLAGVTVAACDGAFLGMNIPCKGHAVDLAGCPDHLAGYLAVLANHPFVEHLQRQARRVNGLSKRGSGMC